MKYGYCGKILRINLTTKEISKEEISENFIRRYMGGKGFIGYYMNKELAYDLDPLGEENKLYFMTGIMSGLPTAGMSRLVIGAKSPLTNGIGHSESGGFVAIELKKAGFDGIIVEGKSKKPAYIWIKDDKVEIKDASNIWGKETGEVTDLIQEELNEKNIRISQIGPAGENMVLYSCIINDLKHACGRTGMGAVMGSKNLRAIAVKGTKEIPFKNKDKILEISKWYSQYFKENPLSYGLYDVGTAGVVTSNQAAGMLPTRNFRQGSFEKADDISGKTMANTILIKREGCYGCPVRCKRVVKVDNENISVDPRFGGPEYETIASMGSLCGIGNLEIIAKAHEICNRLAIDTISAGVSIAFAMECFEKKIITERDTDGIKLEFGNEDALIIMLEKIAKKEGFGEILASGVKRMSERFGIETKDFAMEVKGQEVAMHDPRGKVGVGLGYALSPTGADHMQAAHDTMFAKEGPILDSAKPIGIHEPLDSLNIDEEKVRMYAYLEMWWSFLNSAGVCDFIPAPRGSLSLEKFTKLFKASTGWNISIFEMMKAGERSIVLSRLYNNKVGFKPEDDRLPERFYQPIENGRMKGNLIDKEKFNKSLKSYYKMMNWDEEGMPNKEKIVELEIFK